MTAKRFTFHHDVDGVDYIEDENNGFCLICDELMCSLLNELHEENEQLKQSKDTTFVLINEMIETANLYRTPIKSLHYGDDLGYWNGVYQKLKELKEILFEKGDVE